MGSGSTEMFEAAAAGDRIPRRILLVIIARVLGVVAATILLYFLLPIEGEGAAAAGAVAACLGIALILSVFAHQLGRVSRSQRPVVAALEALALVFGLFVTLFALLYVSVSEGDPQAFTQGIDKIGGLYFTTTVLATVGFGDISPVSNLARVMVTAQMVLGMILIGTAFKALGFSARRAVKARNDIVAQARTSTTVDVDDDADPWDSGHGGSTSNSGDGSEVEPGGAHERG